MPTENQRAGGWKTHTFGVRSVVSTEKKSVTFHPRPPSRSWTALSYLALELGAAPLAHLAGPKSAWGALGPALLPCRPPSFLACPLRQGWVRVRCSRSQRWEARALMVTITWLGSRCLFQRLTPKGVLSREPLVSLLLPWGDGASASSGPRRMGKGRQSASLGLPVVCCRAVSARDFQCPSPRDRKRSPATREVVGGKGVPEIGTVPEIWSHLNWPIVTHSCCPVWIPAIRCSWLPCALCCGELSSGGDS